MLVRIDGNVFSSCLASVVLSVGRFRTLGAEEVEYRDGTWADNYLGIMLKSILAFGRHCPCQYATSVYLFYLCVCVLLCVCATCVSLCYLCVSVLPVYHVPCVCLGCVSIVCNVCPLSIVCVSGLCVYFMQCVSIEHSVCVWVVCILYAMCVH